MVTRLSSDDWIEEGLRTLAKDGHQALRPERLAKRLSVSRGSFYWHFADVGAFETAVLEKWAVVAVDMPYNQAIASGKAEPGASLAALIERVFRAPDALERAVRAWAGVSPMAKDIVSQVDDRRVALLEGLMPRSVAGSARARAVVIYWTYLGHVTVPGLKADDAILAVITELFAHNFPDEER